MEHECYGLRRSVERYFDYVSCQWFLVYIDSEPLVWLQTLRRPKGRMAEWILELQSLDYEVRHRPGILHIAPDALSRLALRQVHLDAERETSLNLRSPFEETEQVSAVAAPLVRAARPARWQGRSVSCILTDGYRVLTVTGFLGGFLLPSTGKACKMEGVRNVAARALCHAAFGRDNEQFTSRLLGTLSMRKVCKTQCIVYAVMQPSSTELLRTFSPSLWGSQRHRFLGSHWRRWHVLAFGQTIARSPGDCALGCSRACPARAACMCCARCLSQRDAP